MEKIYFFLTLIIFSSNVLEISCQIGQNCTGANKDSCCNWQQKGPLAPQNPDFNKNTSQLLETYNIKFDIHYVTTKLGYILNIYRLPGTLNTTNSTKGPIYLNHALLANADAWFIADLATGNTIPQLLLKAGYNVWIPQARGTPLSQGTTNGLNASLYGAYWRFSWHELGSQDAPEIIDYILNITGYSNLAFIGHSMGATEYLVLLSERPEYNAKIKVGILLAPPAFMSNANGVLGISGKVAGDLANLLNNPIIGDGPFPGPHNLTYPVQQSLLGPICSTNLGSYICTNVVFSISGFNLRNTNCSQIGFGISHYPSVGSIRQLLHYAQEIKSGNFCQWDTRDLLLVLLGLPPIPKNYNLVNITAKTAIYYGKKDFLADPTDVEKLIGIINAANPGTLIKFEKLDDYMHLDFLFGIDYVTRIVEPMINVLDSNMPTKS